MINSLFSRLSLQPSQAATAADTTALQHTHQAAPEAPTAPLLTAEQLHLFRQANHAVLGRAHLAGESILPGPATQQILDEASADLRDIAHQSAECLEAGWGAIDTGNPEAAARMLDKLDDLEQQTQGITTLLRQHRDHAISRVMHLEREPAECRHLLQKIAQADVSTFGHQVLSPVAQWAQDRQQSHAGRLIKAHADVHALEAFHREESKTGQDARAAMRCRNELEYRLNPETAFDLPDGMDDFAGGFMTDDWHDAH